MNGWMNEYLGLKFRREFWVVDKDFSYWSYGSGWVYLGRVWNEKIKGGELNIELWRGL